MINNVTDKAVLNVLTGLAEDRLGRVCCSPSMVSFNWNTLSGQSLR